MGGVPIDLLADPRTHDIYASIKFQDKVFVIGPRAISASLRVVKIDTPTAIIGTIRVHGQDTTVSEPYVDTSNMTLIMNVQSLDGGNLNLNIPRAVLDSQKNGTDSLFTVFLNGKELKYQEMTKNPDYRELAMFIPKGSQIIKIVGTTVPVGVEIARKG